MILLHRLTTFVVALFTALVFAVLIYFFDYSFFAIVIAFIGIPLLFARLLKWEVKRFVFWVFLFMPLFLLFSSLFFFLFLESDLLKLFLGIVITLSLWMYAESIFAFYHLPSSYQAYTLEYLSLSFSILAGFLFTAGAYAMQLFLQLPIWIPAIIVFGVVLFSVIVVLWVSKISTGKSLHYAVVGSISLTQIYIVFSFLPTSFFANAASFAIILYLFLGLSRASALRKLSKKVILRYLVTGLILLFAVFLTAKWI